MNCAHLSEPISDSLQKPIEGGSLLAVSAAKPMQKTLKKGNLGFCGCQNQFCRVHVNFCDDAVLELLGFAQHVLDHHVAALGFGVDYVFKLGFPVDYNIEFTHSGSTKANLTKNMVIRALHDASPFFVGISNYNSRNLIPVNRREYPPNRKNPKMPQKNSPSIDIFNMLSSSTEKAAEKPETPKKTQRQELLETTKYKDKDLYPEGTITINKFTCVGVQCKLCIKACPTNALYWTSGGIGVTEDLCLHCEACVLCCMVDDCIKVTRKREDGKTEAFSKPRDVTVLNNQINAQKRCHRIRDIFPTAEDYTEKYPHTKQ